MWTHRSQYQGEYSSKQEGPYVGAPSTKTPCQPMIEAKYIALGRATEQIQWMFSALAEISFGVPLPANLKGNNNGLIAIAKNKKGHNHVKHINVQHHFIHHSVEEGKIQIENTPTKDNIADLFTKLLLCP